MNTVKLFEKEFEPYISYNTIEENIIRISKQINQDLKDKKPIFLGILNGSFMFLGDLMKYVTIDCEVYFVRYKSYEGTTSTGNVMGLIGLDIDLEGRTVVIVEDIVDTGRTISKIIQDLSNKKVDDIKVCTLLHKPSALIEDIKIDYCALEIDNKFILGYGLDFNEYGRNLKDIYIIKE